VQDKTPRAFSKAVLKESATMNRHIYGLTLFLFIVKIHFLLYWAFFAPINFFSTREIPSPQIAPVKTEKLKGCNMRNHLQTDLRNVEINVKKGELNANVDFPNLKTIEDLSDKRFVIHVFSSELSSEWTGEVVSYMARGDGRYTFMAISSKLKQLNRKTNYYAQIESESEHYFKEHSPLNINQATPVLINSDSN
jgi:hypothetical protein